jgi:hypothetical protein
MKFGEAEGKALQLAPIERPVSLLIAKAAVPLPANSGRFGARYRRRTGDTPSIKESCAII